MKLALVGTGRMAGAVVEMAATRGHEVTLQVGSAENPDGRALTPARLQGIDVAIEFTTPSAATANLLALARAGIPTVCGTTGWSDADGRIRREVEEAGTALLSAANFSLGAALFRRMVRDAARLMSPFPEYDPALVEIHHRHKADHPSGTARELAEVLVEELRQKERWEPTPTGPGAPDPAALQVTWLRAGENPGSHAVVFEGPLDRIELRHDARDRRIFALGALRAAEWLPGRSGVFTLDDLLDA